jgi:hypothetical protein
MLAGRPSSGGWEGPAELLALLVDQLAFTMKEGQPGRGAAGAARPPLLRPADCVRIVEAFLPRGPELAGPAVRAHHAAYGHVVCALVQLAGAGLRGSLPGPPGPGSPGGSGGAQQGGDAGPEACGARAAVALCRALAAAFQWLLSGQRGPEVQEEGEEVRRRVRRVTEAALKQLWGSVREHGAYLDPPTWLHAGMRPCSCLHRFPHQNPASNHKKKGSHLPNHAGGSWPPDVALRCAGLLQWCLERAHAVSPRLSLDSIQALHTTVAVSTYSSQHHAPALCLAALSLSGTLRRSTARLLISGASGEEGRQWAWKLLSLVAQFGCSVWLLSLAVPTCRMRSAARAESEVARLMAGHRLHGGQG